MRPVTLVLVVHDHQPVGNFDGVFRAAYDDAYEPFLTFLESRPRLRLALHTSGPLLQWIALHRREYLARLRVLVERNQVELWGGGFFEPVLPAIPEADRRGQILAMADWLELELSQRPRGLWLTERVWEPGLASSLQAAGVAYTAVDDAHFVAAGLEREQLWGIFTTEDQGQDLRVFPIHRELRYAIPFEEPEATVEVLRRVAAGGERRVAVLGDDGEKFGVWPGTKKLCYEERWLERFADALEAEPWIELRTPAEAIAHHASAGLVYLPTASYHEMQEWSLPPAAQRRYREAAARLEPLFGEAARDLLRGGHWRNFLARYPEANRMHKRMLRASRALWRNPAPQDERWREARTHLWRSQCNCPYWHGVFGGLYLPHLRSAVYHDLIAAEARLAADEPRRESGDLDLDGVEDWLLESPKRAAWVAARGGRLWGFDDRETLTNHLDTLARRPELYHEQMAEAATGVAEGKSIHGALKLKDPAVAALAGAYDPRGRDSFLDAWIESGATHDWALEPFRSDGFRRPPAPAGGGGAGVPRRGAGTAGAETPAPALAAIALALDPDGDAQATLALARDEGAAPAIEKRYALEGDGLEVRYTLRSAFARRGTLEVEINLGLHVPEADDRWVEVDGARAAPSHFAARATHAAVSRVGFVDAWADRRIDVAIDRPARLERAPVETASLSEAGAERVFQGVEARFGFDAALEPGRPWSVTFRVTSGRRAPGPA